MLNVQLTQVYTGHADAVYALTAGLSPFHFYSGSGDTFVGCWNLAIGTFEKPVAKTNTAIYAIAGLENSHYLLIGQRGGVIYKADLRKIEATKAVEAHKGDIFGIAIDPIREKVYTCGADGFMRIWSIDTLELISAFHLCNNNVRCIVLSPEGAQLAVGCSDGSMRIFEAETLQQTHIIAAHDSSVFTICWINEKQLLTGGRDALLKRWNFNNTRWKLENTIPAHLFTINHLLLSPDQKFLASASRDKSIKIWEAGTLKLLKVLDRGKFEAAHTHSVNRLLWIGNQQLISAGDDKKILSWEIGF